MRLVIAAAALLASAAAYAQPSVQLAPDEALVSVEAEGQTRSRPDVMTINAGAVTAGATPAEAVEANAALAQRLIAAVRSSGVDVRDIQTSRFTVQPRFEGGANRGADSGPDGRPPRIVGYVVSNSVEIRLCDLAVAEALVSRLFAAGANSVNGPRFSLSDDRAARRAAERAAIEEARAEAENYAAATGRRVGRLLRISDRRTWNETDESDRVVVTGSRVRRTPIEPGEITTRATVHVDFALAPQ